MPPTSGQIIMCDVITGISFHVEEAMTKLVFETVTAQHKRVANCLLVALKPLIEHIVM